MLKTQSLRLSGALLMALGALLFALAGWTFVQDNLLPPPLPDAPRDPSLAAAALAGPELLLPDNSGPGRSDAGAPAAAMPSPTAIWTARPAATATPIADDMPRGRRLPTPTPSPTAKAPAAAAAMSGAPTRLLIPSIGVDTKVIPLGWQAVTRNGQTALEWEVADYAAGWHKNSARPGEVGNIVLSGHNNIKGMVFRRLAEVNIGDTIELKVGDQVFAYTVVDRFIVKEKGEPLAVRQANARWIGPFADTRLTLVSCWPFTNNTHRVIVIAKPAQG